MGYGAGGYGMGGYGVGISNYIALKVVEADSTPVLMCGELSSAPLVLTGTLTAAYISTGRVTTHND